MVFMHNAGQGTIGFIKISSILPEVVVFDKTDVVVGIQQILPVKVILG